MLVIPKYEEKGKGKFKFGFKTNCVANTALNKPVFKEIWKGFCCQGGEIEFAQTDDCVIKVGKNSNLEIPKSGYEMEITEQGILIVASDCKNLIYGFFALLERITPICVKKGEESFSVDCCKIKDEASVQTRMTHLCIFPETDMPFIKKFIRFASFLRYTHIIVEFWGTIKYDSLKELAWANHSFTKEELCPLFEEARDMGVQIIPMFNHWGHASGSRVKSGKHVVLDQNMALAPLFSRTGWEWNLKNAEVIELISKIRKELIELCGAGDYFHIGCDEAYSAKTKEDFEEIINYVNEVSKDLEKQGRKTIIWGDMLLHKDAVNPQTNNSYTLLNPDFELQKTAIKLLSRSVVIADWQYGVDKYPIETALFFKQNGFEVLCCPWDYKENVIASAKTIKEHGLLGVIHTTWDTLRSSKGMRALMYSASLNWGELDYNVNHSYHSCEIASLLRKLAFSNGEYENCGWEKKQILD